MGQLNGTNIMGQWHGISRFSKSLLLVTQDVELQEIYKKELEWGWTEAKNYRNWFDQFKRNTLRYTNRKVIEFLPYNTYNNKKYKERHLKSMNAGNKKNKDRHIKGKTNISQKDYDIILNVLLDELLGEDSTKKERNNKVSEVIEKIKNKKNNCSASISSLCKLFGISRSRFYDRKDNVGYKKRKDSKVTEIEMIALVNEVFNQHKGNIGSDKISGLIKKDYGINISQPTVSKIMSNSHLCVNSTKNKPKNFKEDKNTKDDFEYLVDFEKRQELKPYEAVSADFMIIKNKDKHYHLHMIADIKTHKIVAYTLSDNQSASIVYKDITKLKDLNVKIMNTDHGTQYFEKNVRTYLESIGVKQSMGRVGHSNDNLWIEYIFGRIREELFSQYNINKLDIKYVKRLIDNYVEYWNNERPIKTLNYMSPNEYINFLNERNCPEYLY
ncbi:IS3 family transposase [Mycoplasma sp. VS424B]|uniref:IS3 family transposase n=2 Tax=unclassified Mycoplasma TaxID=2683645 RepID=UPI003AAC7BE3